MSGPGIFGVVACVLGLGFLYHAARFLWSRRKYARGGVVVPGQVVGEERKTATVPRAGSDLRRKVTYSYPVVAFQTLEGQQMRASTDVNADKPYPVGSPVNITYLPEDPTKIRLVGESHVRWIPLVIVAIGVVLLLVGIVLLANSAGGW